MNLAHRLQAMASRRPAAPALLFGPQVLTYRDLEQAAAVCAGTLRAHGVGRADRVALLSGSSRPEVVAALFGAWKLGAVAVPLNAQLTAPEFAFQLRDAGAAVALAEPGGAFASLERAASQLQVRALVPFGVLFDGSHGEPVREVAAGGGADATICYTSGTTATPKGATHTHRSLLVHLEMLRRWYRVTGADVLLQSLPLSLLSVQLMGPLLAVHAGARCRLLPRFSAADVAEHVRTDRVTLTGGVPLLLWDLLRLADGGAQLDLSSLRVLHVGGSPTAPGVRERFERRLGCLVFHAYGATEAPNLVSGDPYGRASRAGSAGVGLPHLTVSVRDEDDRPLPAGELGELCVAPRDDGPFAGLYEPVRCYRGLPDATAEALRGGRLHLGDLGYVDGDGFVFVVDRKKDLIIRGGFNIASRELEQLLESDPRVVECAVVGAPHPRYGEVPVAYVRLAGPAGAGPAGAGLAEAEQVRGDVNRRLARVKQLAELVVVDDLPRNAMGKVVKRELRDDARHRHQAADGPPR